MKLSESINPQWQSYLRSAQWRTFEDIWSHKMERVENPNRRGKGYSEVGCITLTKGDGEKAAKKFYVKRQHRYRARTISHPFLGMPITEKECKNIMRLQGLSINCMDWAYHGYDAATSRSILVTADLSGCLPVDHYCKPRSREILADAAQVVALQSSAQLIARLHDHGLQHSALYPHHVYVDVTSAAAYLIDLEGLFQHPLGRMRVRVKDLSTFFRRAQMDSVAQALFMKTYIACSSTAFSSKRLNRRIQRRTLRKVKGLERKSLRKTSS